MAWEWSHSAEGESNVFENIHNHTREWLLEAYGEWFAWDGEDINSFDFDKYREAIKKAEKLPNDILADYIWEQASQHRYCSNGGHNAWCCPSGCHIVSFDFLES